MKLGHKLLLAPVLTAVVVLATGQIDSWVLRDAAQQSSAGFEEHVGELQKIAEAQGTINSLHVDVYRSMTVIGSMDDAAVQAKRKQVAETVNKVKGLIDAQLANNPEDSSPIRQSLQVAMGQLQDYGGKADSALDLASVDPNTGVAAMQNADELFVALVQSLTKVEDALAQHASDFAREQSSSSDRMHWLFSLLSALAAVVAVVGSGLLLRRVAVALDQAADVARKVADGDLGVRVETDRRDELGDLLRSLGAMKDSLLNTVRQVRETTDSIGTASAQIATGNQDLSARTEQTASNLQQTASSMEELTSTVRQSADAARQANQLAASATEIAQRGGTVVAQVVTTMDEINHSSKKISDIIGVIDGIAFQTNILALNAAVEAARAGEQGRGFAVVAGEVRNLAQRSAEAAKEIKGLIGTSVDKVEAGSRLVADAGQTMSEIVGSVQRVTDIIGEISAAAGEQSDGIGQVNTAVNQLDQMTQQNAALVEESAAAAESLKDQARRLAQVVAVFRVEGGSVVTAVTQAHSPAPVATPAVAIRPSRQPATSVAPKAFPVRPQIPRSEPTNKATSTTPSKPAAGSDEGDWESF